MLLRALLVVQESVMKDITSSDDVDMPVKQGCCFPRNGNESSLGKNGPDLQVTMILFNICPSRGEKYHLRSAGD